MGHTVSTDLDRSIELVLVRVRVRARLRVEWLRELWRESAAQPPGTAVSHGEVDLCLDDRDNPDAQAAWLHQADVVGEGTAIGEVEKRLASDTTSRLAHLLSTFGLSDAERDLLHICLAAAIDPALARVYAYLQDIAHRAHVTDSLVARMFDHGRTLPIESDAPVFRWAIIERLEVGPDDPPAYRLDPGVRDWLLGREALDPQLVQFGGSVTTADSDATEPLEEWTVDGTVEELKRWLRGRSRRPVRLRVLGPEGSGRKTFAGLVAARFDMPMLVVDASRVEPDAWRQIEGRIHRRALLDGLAVCISPPPSFWSEPRPAMRPAVPLEFVITDSDQVIPPPIGPEDDTIDDTVELPPPTTEARRRLWHQHAPWSAKWPSEQFDELVRQHRALPGDIARIAARGKCSHAETSALIRIAARQSLGELAQRLDCPFTRDDLVVTPHVSDTLDDLLFEARDRVAFWERPEAQRLFPQGRGLLALFSGPSGTGKTMSAQVLAAALGMDLFRIDLAAVVSKWVGETSRNLDRLLRRAADLDVVLLFDEADALFSKRTEIKEANDRFANSDTGYLLQAIESYPGVAVLSTNRKGNIDPAFIRRLRYVLEFPVPTEHERLLLWQKIVGELGGDNRCRELTPTLQQLAVGVEVTGAQIKLAVLTAAFAARRDGSDIHPAHLLHGLERELAKEGRPIGDRLRDRLTGPRAAAVKPPERQAAAS